MRAVGMVDRRIYRRALGQTRQQRGFLQSQLLRRLAEIKLRRGLESVHAVPEKNLVRIEREDLRLGETALDLDGQHRLLHLALTAAIGRQKKIARELHGQGRSALHLAAGLDVAIGRADDPPEIDAGVPVEIFVFNRNQRVAQHRREIVVADDHAALQRERSDDAAVIVVKFGDGTGPVSFQGVDLRQVGGVDEQTARRSLQPAPRPAPADRTERGRPVCGRRFPLEEDFRRETSSESRIRVEVRIAFRAARESRTCACAQNEIARQWHAIKNRACHLTKAKAWQSPTATVRQRREICLHS